MSGREGAQTHKVTALHELPQAIEPPRDLWPGIEARLEPVMAGAPAVPEAQLSAARRRTQQLRWFAAAAMVASVAVGVWIDRSLLPVGNRAQGSTLAAFDAPTALDVAYVTDPRYQRQRAALLRSLESQIATLPPATRTKVMASLATIQHAKEDLEQALGKDPGNALLQELLVNTYQDEMRVLSDVREASDPGKGI